MLRLLICFLTYLMEVVLLQFGVLDFLCILIHVCIMDVYCPVLALLAPGSCGPLAENSEALPLLRCVLVAVATS